MKYLKENKVEIIFIIVVFAYLLQNTIAVAMNGGPWTSDYGFHKAIVERWINGENPLLDSKNVNGFPYPPLFHLSIAAYHKLTGINIETIFSAINIITLPTIIFVTYSVTKRITNKQIAIISVLLACSGFAFWDRPNQPIPNALDMFLLPLIFYSYAVGKKDIFIFSSVAIVYNHFIYGLMPLLGLTFFTLYKRISIRYTQIGSVWIWITPLLVLFFRYTKEILEFGTDRETTIGQYVIATTNPFWDISYLGLPLAIIILIGLIKVMGDFIQAKPFQVVQMERILLIWVVSYIPILAIYPHRGITFLVQPLSILAAVFLHNRIDFDDKIINLVGIWFLYYLVQLSHIFAQLRSPFISNLNYILIGWTAIGG